MSLLNMSYDEINSQNTSPEIRQSRIVGENQERDNGRRRPELSSAMPHQFTAVSKNRKMRSFRADPW
jgi:hypothetical protein